MANACATSGITHSLTRGRTCSNRKQFDHLPHTDSRNDPKLNSITSSGNASQRLEQKLIAGLADAGMSSAASFLVGLLAIRTLSPDALGVYSVLFSAWVVGAVVSAEAFFYPRLVTLMKRPSHERTFGLARTVVSSSLHGMAGGAVVVLAALAISSQAEPGFLLTEGLASFGLVTASPAQDYLRRVLHLSEQSWKASLVSAGQLIFVLGWFGFGVATDLELGGSPLLILFAANVASILLGFLLVGRRGTNMKGAIALDPNVHSGSVFRSAAFFLGSGLLASVIMSWLVGPAIVGYSEAARTAAQPLLVIGIGLNSALSSRSLKAVHDRDLTASRRATRLFLFICIAASLVLLAIYNVDWTERFATSLMPAAFEVPGLVILWIAAHFLVLASGWRREQLINVGREKEVARTDTWVAAFPVVIAFLSPGIGAFARATGVFFQSGFRWSAYDRRWSALFQDSANPPRNGPTDRSHSSTG